MTAKEILDACTHMNCPGGDYSCRGKAPCRACADRAVAAGVAEEREALAIGAEDTADAVEAGLVGHGGEVAIRSRAMCSALRGFANAIRERS